MLSLVTSASSASPLALTVREITRPSGLAAIAEEWALLWDRCPGATPFQRPEWLIPWCERVGPDTIWALELRRRGRLVGLAPLAICPRDGERAVVLLGGGVSDYLDVLVDPEVARAGAFAIGAYLAASADLWDVCDFEALHPAATALRLPIPPAWNDDVEQDDVCPVLRLPSSVERLNAVVPDQMLRSVRRAKDRAAMEGELSFTTAQAATRAEILDALYGLQEKRWTLRSSTGGLGDAAVQALHREASAGLLSVGRLLLHAVRLDGRIIAVVYGFLGDGRAYLYLQGFDPEHERLSPGALAVAHAIEDAARAGAREVDFLRGRERYKYMWGAFDQPTYRRRIRRA